MGVPPESDFDVAGIGHDIAHGLKEVCDIDVVTPETGLQRAGEEMGRGDDPGREDRRITMEPLDPRGILSQRISALLRDSCGINTMFFFLFFSGACIHRRYEVESNCFNMFLPPCQHDVCCFAGCRR